MRSCQFGKPWRYIVTSVVLSLLTSASLNAALTIDDFNSGPFSTTLIDNIPFIELIAINNSIVPPTINLDEIKEIRLKKEKVKNAKTCRQSTICSR